MMPYMLYRADTLYMYMYYFYSPRLDTTARSPDSTGQILFVFYEIYRVGYSARCRVNFARKGILVCVFKSDFDRVFLQIWSLFVGYC
jgi:hypothetical protein